MESEKNQKRNELFWLAGISEAQKTKILNDLYIRSIFDKVKNNEKVSLFVNSSRGIILKQQMADMYEQWCKDYIDGKTEDIPSTKKIAKHFGVNWSTAALVTMPFDTKYFNYNYISGKELKEIGLHAREDISKED
jgi:hypothetical protein